jgi:chromosome segregation ATPase
VEERRALCIHCGHNIETEDVESAIEAMKAHDLICKESPLVQTIADLQERLDEREDQVADLSIDIGDKSVELEDLKAKLKKTEEKVSELEKEKAELACVNCRVFLEMKAEVETPPERTDNG